MKWIYSKLTVFLALISFAGLNYESIMFSEELLLASYIIRALITTLSFALFFYFLNKKPDKKMIYLILLFFAMYFLSVTTSLLNGNLSADFIVKATFSLGLYIYLITAIFIECNNLLKGSLYFFGFIMMINYIMYFFFPDIGVYDTTANGLNLMKGILTNRNSIILYVLPFIFLLLITEEKKSLLKYFIVLISIVQVFLTGSQTGQFAITLFLILIIIHRKIFVPTKTYFSIAGLSILSISLFGVNNHYFNNFITNILGSDITMSGRTFIWEVTSSLIFQSLLIGHGGGSIEIARQLGYMRATNGNYIVDPFNGFLSILYFQGTLGFVIFLFVLFYIISQLDKFRILKKIRYGLITILLFIIISFSESILSFNSFYFWVVTIISVSLVNHEKTKKYGIIE